MKLTRIEALRYGALENACVSGLGDGLTVVLGPNESGKTTFTALARHVLYGYPKGSTNERGYVPAAGPRVARLVFADETGEWNLERVEGTHGGPVTIEAVRGAERPGLLGELVAGVSQPAFKVVFGFGIDELARIQRGGDADDIVGRLYAAGAGLSVNPMDVKKQLADRGAELYRPGGSKPVVNALAARLRALKEQIRGLEAQAATFADDQARLHGMETRLAPLQAERDDLDLSLRQAEADTRRAKDSAEQLSIAVRQLGELNARIADAASGLDFIDVDDRVLAAAPVLGTVLEELPLFRQRLDAAAASESKAEDIERTLRAARLLPEAAQDSVEIRAELDRWRDRLTRLDIEVEGALRTAEQAEARFAGAQGDKPAPGAQTVKAPVASIVVAVVGLLAGVGLLAFGLLTGPLAAALAGGAIAAASIGALIVVLARRPRAATSPLDAELERQAAEARSARVLAQTVAAKQQAALSEWRAWLAGNGLDAFGEDPAAVAGLLDALRERSAVSAELQRHRTDAERDRQSAEDWVVRLVDVVRRFDDTAGQIPVPSAALELAAKAKSALEANQTAAAERAVLARELESVRSQRERLGQFADTLKATVAAIAESHGVDPADPVPALEALGARTSERLNAARTECEELAADFNELRGKLNDEGRDDEMARARQQLEGLRAQADASADRYLVSALAARLMDDARERFERDRQPEVVRTAARVFSAMTGGRYTDVSVPLGSEVVVVGADRTRRTATELSRGTAEQLYLALRVGLIGSLGEQGRMLPVLMDDVVVNFDPERRAGAVAAISELAAIRQVLFFTCHPETAAALMAHVSGSVLVQLDRCAMHD